MLIDANSYGARRLFTLFGSFLSLMFAAGNVIAQDDADDEEFIEEIITVGSQIRGASISDALSVSIISAEDIAALGIDSGDQLLEQMTEQGQNFFAESENISGGVNAARGDRFFSRCAPSG